MKATAIATAASLFVLFGSTFAFGQVILVPNSERDVVGVLDASTGNFIEEFNVGGFTEDSINVIDGPGNTLLLSDETNRTVYQLDSQGNLLGQYLNQLTGPDVQGIHLFPDGTLGTASATGVEFWDARGNRLGSSIAGEFADVSLFRRFRLLSDEADDRLRAFDQQLQLFRQTAVDSVAGAEQIAVLSNSRVAVVAGDTNVLLIYAPTGLVNALQLPAGGAIEGVYGLPNGNFIVTNDVRGIEEYASNGDFVRTIRAGEGWSYLDLSLNYQP